MIGAACAVAICNAGRTSEPLLLRLAERDHFPCPVQLPWVVVSSRFVPPPRHTPQYSSPPCRQCIILHGRVPTLEHAREVPHPTANALGKPWRILVAYVVHPLGLAPLL